MCKSSSHNRFLFKLIFRPSSLIWKSPVTIPHGQWMEWSSCDRFCSGSVFCAWSCSCSWVFVGSRSRYFTRAQCRCSHFVTWLFLRQVFSFHFTQVRIQTVPASHLQQGTVSGSTKAVSTVVVTTAPSPKQTQDQLWTLVWTWITF